MWKISLFYPNFPSILANFLTFYLIFPNFVKFTPRGLYFPADVYIFPVPPASDVYIFPNFAQRYRAERENFLGKNNAFRENLG